MVIITGLSSKIKIRDLSKIYKISLFCKVPYLYKYIHLEYKFLIYLFNGSSNGFLLKQSCTSSRASPNLWK